MLQLVDVLGESFPTLFATGLPCGGAVSVASDGGRLHVVHGMPSESYMYTSTLNGTTFTTQTPSPSTRDSSAGPRSPRTRTGSPCCGPRMPAAALTS